MPRWPAAFALLAAPGVFTAPLLSAGCLYCDCLMDSVGVEIVDEAGEPRPVDEVRVAGPDGFEVTDTCLEGGDCSGWLIPIEQAGPHTITALIGGEVVGEVTITVDEARGGPGCCTDVLHAEGTLQIAGG